MSELCSSMTDLKMKKAPNKPEIFFITNNPKHPTNNDIIKELSSMNNVVGFETIDPASQTEIFAKRIGGHQHLRNILLLIKPDHSNAYKICDLAIKMGLKTINDPSITKLFVNRYKTEKLVGELLNSMKNENIIKEIKMPKSWFIKFELDSGHSRIINYIQDLSKSIPFSPPFIIKTPCNHDGLHFVRRISALEELMEYEDMIRDTGLILQQYIRFSPPLLKCYTLGDITVTLEDNITLGSRTFDSKDIVLQEKIKYKKSNNDMKESRPKVETPNEFKILTRFIKKKLNLDLFGIDFAKGTDRFYYILDINDFPGFRGIPRAGKLIAEHCLKCLSIK